ncbi:hypothetical protein [Parabacteroides sp.]
MSKHVVENLVECSVMTVATASPVPSLAPSICYSLYALQSQFDNCGNTVLRIKDELIKLGYLYLLPSDQLPESERKRRIEFDSDSGCYCVTAGSNLWKKLLLLGILPESAKIKLKELYPMELAEIIIPLASKALSEGDKNAAKTLGLWYALFPLFCMAAGYDADDHPEPEKIQKLLKLMAVPKAFKEAEKLSRELAFDDFDEEEMPFLSGWWDPYEKWNMRKNKRKKNEIEAFLKELMGVRGLEVHKCLAKIDFAGAYRCASTMEDKSGYDRLFFRCMVSLAYHQWVVDREIKIPLLNDILSLEEAKEGYEYLINLPASSEDVHQSRLSIFRILALQGKYAEAVEYLNTIYSHAFDNLDQDSKGLLSQANRAVIVVFYYQLLEMSIPDSFPGKKRLIAQDALSSSDFRKSRDILCLLLMEKSEQAEAWQLALAFCDEMIQKYGL